MSIDNVAAGDPPLEKPGTRLEIAPHERALSIPCRHTEHALDESVAFVEVRLPACGQSVDRRNTVDLRTAIGCGMKRGQNMSCSRQFRCDVGSSIDERVDSCLSLGNRRITTAASMSLPSASRTSSTPRYTSGASRRFSATSLAAGDQPRLRGGEVDERKPHAFFRFRTVSPSKVIRDTWVSITRCRAGSSGIAGTMWLIDGVSINPGIHQRPQSREGRAHGDNR